MALNLRSVDLNLLPIFDAVMQEGNLTRAAASIGMSQPAISEALARLRHVLKDDLFIRSGHGVRPTPRAQELAAPIRQILDLTAKTLTESLQFDHKTSTRRFNLVLREYGELVLLAPLMQWLEKADSQVFVSVNAVPRGDITESLRKGEVDIYLTTDPPHSPHCSSQRVITDYLVSLARRDHPVVKKKLTLAQYLALDHVVLDWPDIATPHADLALLKGGPSQRKRKMLVHSIFDMPRVVASTNMLCAVPARMASSLAQAHALKVFPLPIDRVDIPIYLCWSTRFDTDPGHIWIRNLLSHLLEGLELA